MCGQFTLLERLGTVEVRVRWPRSWGRSKMVMSEPHMIGQDGTGTSLESTFPTTEAMSSTSLGLVATFLVV
jgi:hypothetical protein